MFHYNILISLVLVLVYMQLLDSYVNFCFAFPKLSMFECSVWEDLLLVAAAEIATSSLKNSEKRSCHKGGNTKSGCTLPTALKLT
jgi:hypothetical protein